jgi:hypothetical protein
LQITHGTLTYVGDITLGENSAFNTTGGTLTGTLQGYGADSDKKLTLIGEVTTGENGIGISGFIDANNSSLDIKFDFKPGDGITSVGTDENGNTIYGAQASLDITFESSAEGADYNEETGEYESRTSLKISFTSSMEYNNGEGVTGTGDGNYSAEANLTANATYSTGTGVEGDGTGQYTANATVTASGQWADGSSLDDTTKELNATVDMALTGADSTERGFTLSGNSEEGWSMTLGGENGISMGVNLVDGSGNTLLSADGTIYDWNVGTISVTGAVDPPAWSSILPDVSEWTGINLTSWEGIFTLPKDAMGVNAIKLDTTLGVTMAENQGINLLGDVG